MEPSRRQDLITAQQLARLSLHRFYCAASGLKNSTLREGGARMSDAGPAMGTRGGKAGVLAWAIAQTAQSCAYLAGELQVAAEKYSLQTLDCHESTYRQLLDSIAIFQALLDVMRAKYRHLSVEEDFDVLPVLSVRLAEEIRSSLAHGLAITMVECMTSTESQETSSTESVGDMK